MKVSYSAICSKSSLAKIRIFAKEALDTFSVRSSQSDEIILAIDEACANSIIHQHCCDGKSTIEVEIYKKGNAIHVDIKDEGTPFPIHEYTPENIDDLICKKARGGLGIMLITKIMDKVELIRNDQHFTYRLIKYVD